MSVCTYKINCSIKIEFLKKKNYATPETLYATEAAGIGETYTGIRNVMRKRS